MLWIHTTRALRPCLRTSLPPNGLSRVPRVGRFMSDNVPSFREQVTRTGPGVESFSEQMKRPTMRNQLLFFIAGGYLTYSFAAAQTNIETEHWSKKIKSMSGVWSNRNPTSDEMRRTQNFELGTKLQNYVTTLKEITLDWPIILKNEVFKAYVSIAQPYLNASEGRRLCWKIIALNSIVWVAWQIPRLQPAMMRSFAHNPLSGLSYTMLTSMFSHKSFIHLLFNNLALASFGSAATNWLTKEQFYTTSGLQESTSTYHFLAFFLSAGLFSGLVSHVAATKFIFPRLVSRLSKVPPAATTTTTTAAATKSAISRISPPPTAAVRPILPSLGASGAIYAAVTLTALGYPDSDIGLLFLPMVTFPIQWGVGALVCVDMLGIIRGWRMFDHYAHLGGAMFGVGYHMYGAGWWDRLRMRTMPPQRKKEEEEEAEKTQ